MLHFVLFFQKVTAVMIHHSDQDQNHHDHYEQVGKNHPSHNSEDSIELKKQKIDLVEIHSEKRYFFLKLLSERFFPI